MILIIAGPRDIDHEAALREVNLAVAHCPWDGDVTEIVHGDARGVDTAAAEWARGYGVRVTPFPANWSNLGRSVGPIRNGQMARYAREKCGALVALWDGKSRGTANMIATAARVGLQAFVWPVRR